MHGNISAAANVLNISQPAVSQAIKQLEKNLGTTLFVRKSKGVEFTFEGNILYSYVKQGYEQILLGQEKIFQMKNMEQGEVRIGASDMTLRYYLLDYLEEFHNKYPGINVFITNAPTPNTLKYLEEGKIDFGIISGPVEENSQLRLESVRKVHDIFIAGEKYSEYKEKVLELKNLEELPLVCLEPNTSTRKYMDNFLRENGVEVVPEFEIATSDMIVEFVAKNFGVGCVVSDFAEEFIKSGRVFQLNLSKEIPTRDFYLATNSRIPMTNAGKALYEMLINVI